MLLLTDRRRNVLSGAIALLLLVSAITVGVKSAFGAYAGGYRVTGSFDAAGQGLLGRQTSFRRICPLLDYVSVKRADVRLVGIFVHSPRRSEGNTLEEGLGPLGFGVGLQQLPEGSVV